MYQDIMERVIIRGKGRKRSKKRKADGPFFPPTPNKPQGLTFWGGGRSFESAKNVIKGKKVDEGVHFDSHIKYSPKRRFNQSIPSISAHIIPRRTLSFVQPSFYTCHPHKERKKIFLCSSIRLPPRRPCVQVHRVGLPSRPEGFGF